MSTTPTPSRRAEVSSADVQASESAADTYKEALRSEFDHSTVLFLLGAGASHDGGLPLSRQITQLALADLALTETPDFGNGIELALRYVCGALIKYDTDRGGSPSDLPDIELVVSAVELLSQKDLLEVSPFVDAWDPMVDKTSPSPFPAGFDNQFDKVVGGGGSAEQLLRQAIRAEIGKGNARIWDELRAHLVRDLRKRVLIPDIAEFSYLAPLVALGGRRNGVTIVTLNYDLSIELQAQHLGISCDTGIQSWIAGSEVLWQPGGLHLLKLHGSIGWSFFDQRSEPGRLAEGLFLVADANVRGSRPAVVFGQREKLRAEGPFLEIFGEFRRRLALSSLLVVVGYSFRDQHVNETIRHWINGDTSRRIIVIDPDFPPPWRGSSSRDFDFRHELNQALLPRRLPGQAPPVPFRLDVVRKTAKEGLADLGL